MQTPSQFHRGFYDPRSSLTIEGLNAPKHSIHQVAAVIGPFTILGLLMWFAGWTGTAHRAGMEALWVLMTSGACTLLWLGAALGIGWPLRSFIARSSEEPVALQIALGVAAMLTLDTALGSLTWLQSGGAIGAWLVTVVGVALLLVQIARWVTTRPDIHPRSWLIWTAGPAIAVLLLAACSAPGWLWSTEFGGYDALSYHLQLPREWVQVGGIRPLEHNVYSFLPGYVESAYYHLWLLAGQDETAMYASQLLHAAFALLAAFLVKRLTQRLAGPVAGDIAAVALLATPWVVVVGSLAYNEMPTLLMLAAGVIASRESAFSAARKGIIIGILSGAACGAKLTSIGFVAAPLALLLLVNLRASQWGKAAVAGAGAAFIVLLPYLLRNQIHAGNPIFPFGTSVLGTAHWSPEQAQIWNHGHFSNLGLAERGALLWHEFFRFGIGNNPNPAEPWLPQWAALPWLALAGLIVGLAARHIRRATVNLAFVLLVQLCFWIFFTHLKSRFLIPLAVPMAVLAGILLARIAFLPLGRILPHVILALTLAVAASLPAIIFFGERNGEPSAMIGKAGLLSGNRLSQPDRVELGRSFVPSVSVNYLLPPDSRVLLVGDATPLYHRLDRIAYQTTWDRGLLSNVMRDFPDQPDEWLAALRANGISHVLVDEPMLRRWEQSRWNDSRLTADRVLAFAEHHARLMFRYANGAVLYELTKKDAETTERTP